MSPPLPRRRSPPGAAQPHRRGPHSFYYAGPVSCDQQDDTQTLASIMERFSRRDLSFLSGLIAEIVDLEQRFGPEIAIEKIHEINATLGLDSDELSHPDTRRNR